MTPRRIAYVLKIFPKLSETFITAELVELRRRQVEVCILSLLPPRDELRHDIVSRAGLDQLAHYEPAEFAAVLKGFQPDVLHAHFATEATATARDLAAAHAWPFTFTSHGYDIYRKPPPDFHARVGAAHAVITVSRANADRMVKHLGVQSRRIRVIPCGVDTEQFRPGDRGAGSTGPPVILCVARQVVVKNLGLLLQSCAILQRRGLNFRCVLIGDGPCRGELALARDRLGLQQIVEMPGAAEQNKVCQWWQHAEIGVLTSDNEGMPVCLMEAAACGVPVVSTGVGGVPELVEEGVTGLLARAGDATAVASALERLLSDHDLRTRMSLAARRRAVERFSVVRQVDQLLAVWSEILDGGAR